MSLYTPLQMSSCRPPAYSCTAGTGQSWALKADPTPESMLALEPPSQPSLLIQGEGLMATLGESEVRLCHHQGVTCSRGLCPSLLVGMTVLPSRHAEDMKGLEENINQLREVVLMSELVLWGVKVQTRQRGEYKAAAISVGRIEARE